MQWLNFTTWFWHLDLAKFLFIRGEASSLYAANNIIGPTMELFEVIFNV